MKQIGAVKIFDFEMRQVGFQGIDTLFHLTLADFSGTHINQHVISAHSLVC